VPGLRPRSFGPTAVCSGCGHQLKVQRAGFTVQRVAFWAGLNLVGMVVAFFGSAVISGVIAAKDLDSLYVTEPLYLELVDGQLPPAGTLTERVSPGTRVRRFPDPPRTLTLASGAIVAFVRVQVISTGTTHPDVSSAMAQTLAADPVAQPNDVGWMGAWPSRLSDRNSFALDGG
jgi:hypothetical protein